MHRIIRVCRSFHTRNCAQTFVDGVDFMVRHGLVNRPRHDLEKIAVTIHGRKTLARRRVTSSPGRTTGRDEEYCAALALAYARDNTRAQALSDDLSKRFPDETIVQFNYLPTLRAKLAVSRGNTSEAIETLRIAAPNDLAKVGATNDWAAVYPIYVRAEAYLGAHEGVEAAAEFQKILDHRGIVLNEPIGALAHLGLARSYALQGDSLKARVAYQNFLTLWKDADPEFRSLSVPNPNTRSSNDF